MSNKVNMSLPQGYQLIQTIAKDSNSTTPLKDVVYNPSVMVVGWIPTIGDGNTLQSGQVFATNAKANPINVAMANYYAKIRSANSSLSAYTASDIGKVLLALDSLYGLLAENQVDIIALGDYRKDNMAFRGLLVEALWNQPNNAVKDISNLIARHNVMCDKLKALPFIPNIPFLKDHIEWASNVYRDDNCDKSALILFRRAGYYYWEVDSADPDPGFLMLRDGNLNTYSYTTLDRSLYAEERMNIIEYLIQQYLLDDDMLNIAAEIYKAFGYDPDAYRVPKLPEKLDSIRLETKYDLDVIDSLRNADFSYLDATKSIYGIGENTNGHLVYAVAGPTSTINLFPIAAVANGTNGIVLIDTGDNRVIQSYEDEPSDESLRVSTRYTHQYKDIGASNGTSYVYGLRSEFLTSVRLITYDPTVPSNVIKNLFNLWIDKVSNVAIDDALRLTTPLTAFPPMHLLSITSTGSYTGTKYDIRKDLDNLGFIDNAWLSQLAQEELLDKFGLTKSKSNNNNKNK